MPAGSAYATAAAAPQLGAGGGERSMTGPAGRSRAKSTSKAEALPFHVRLPGPAGAAPGSPVAADGADMAAVGNSRSANSFGNRGETATYDRPQAAWPAGMWPSEVQVGVDPVVREAAAHQLVSSRQLEENLRRELQVSPSVPCPRAIRPHRTAYTSAGLTRQAADGARRRGAGAPAAVLDLDHPQPQRAAAAGNPAPAAPARRDAARLCAL